MFCTVKGRLSQHFRDQNFGRLCGNKVSDKMHTDDIRMTA